MSRAALLILGCVLVSALTADDSAAQCPAPAKSVQASCKEITYKELPREVLALLKQMKCDVSAGGNYDYGSAVDLNGDGSPEYQVCCHETAHGPCGAVLIGKVGEQWKDLTAREGSSGFEGACNLFIVLEAKRSGFHDICLPNDCAPGTGTGSRPCLPTIWQYENGRYRSTATKPENK